MVQTVDEAHDQASKHKQPRKGEGELCGGCRKEHGGEIVWPCLRFQEANEFLNCISRNQIDSEHIARAIRDLHLKKFPEGWGEMTGNCVGCYDCWKNGERPWPCPSYNKAVEWLTERGLS
ncbi:hypothetical protein [Longispora albida]|uniref:hypothetical protein n=1 Tax=Longispora albida TaxID=203523 RepID=UPI000374DFA5|nr:hypothetical protein [Longispora albida]